MCFSSIVNPKLFSASIAPTATEAFCFWKIPFNPSS